VTNEVAEIASRLMNPAIPTTRTPISAKLVYLFIN